MEEQRPESNFIKRQRWSGLWNGVVIGMGLSWLLLGQYIGVLPLALGIVMEVMQRKRLDRVQ
ncbi:MAG: hypothetical protein ABID84_03100 [Chloroflexota bacterium]